MLRARENRQRHHAGEASDQSGDQECAADPGCCLRAEDCSATCGDRREDRDAERAADLVPGRIEPRDHPVLFLASAGEDRHRDRHGRDAKRDTGDEHAGQDVGQVAAVCADAGQEEHADRRHREGSGERAADTVLGDHVASCVRSDSG